MKPKDKDKDTTAQPRPKPAAQPSPAAKLAASCAAAAQNATPPSPGIAPGSDGIDPAAFARAYTIDPRVPAAVPGFDAPFFQAGLAGYSDAAMRIVARRHGCPCCVTEALLDRTLLAGGRGFAKADLGELHDNVPGGIEDHPLIGQIMGSDPDEMARAASKMIDRNKDAAHAFAAIDVNLACPVKKISAKARGGHWLRDPEGAIEILRAVRDAVPPEVPTTLKVRRAWDETPKAERAFYTLFDGAYELGYAWAVVHGRTVTQKYVGPSRWDALREIVCRRPDRVIMGSGDIWAAPDIFRMLSYTGVHGVSVARGCIGNPWIFRQARNMLAGEQPVPPTLAQQRTALLDHFELCKALHGDKKASVLMRKFGIRFATHHPHSNSARRRFIAVGSEADWLTAVDDLYPQAGPTEAPKSRSTD